MLNRVEELRKRNEELDAIIDRLKILIADCPTDNLISRINPAGQVSFYLQSNQPDGKRKETYIRKEDIALAEKFATRDYAKAKLKDVVKERNLVKQQIRFLTEEKETERYLLSHPRQAKLIESRLLPKDEYARKWMLQEYTKSNKNPEVLTIPTVLPELKVRSKSEAEIVHCLVENEVAFHYEELKVINGIALHPDFTCLNARTRTVFYIEHQGKWDDPGYVKDVRWREDLYLQAGIYPWKQLLITTETKEHPFDVNWFQVIIDYYLK